MKIVQLLAIPDLSGRSCLATLIGLTDTGRVFVRDCLNVERWDELGLPSGCQTYLGDDLRGAVASLKAQLVPPESDQGAAAESPIPAVGLTEAADTARPTQRVIDAIIRHSHALDTALGEAIENMESVLRLREEIDADHPTAARSGWGSQSKGYPDHTLAEFYRVAAQIIRDIKCNATECGGGVTPDQIDRLQRLMDSQYPGKL